MKTQTAPHTNRSGFTLLELLIVMVIISILLALLTPAIIGVFSQTAELEVGIEISQLDQALVAFKQRFGEYPPSSLTIPTVGGTWGPSDLAKVRQIWPEFDFTANGGLGNAGALTLNGAECLMFFLGGVQSGGTSAPVLSGFAKNPRTPWTASENPDGPYMQFDLARVSDVDGDGVFEYLDPIADQTTPYLYVSAAGRKMKKNNTPGEDLNQNCELDSEEDTNGNGILDQDDYDVFTCPDLDRNMTTCYLQPGGNNEPYRKDTFQLISPGGDGEYGAGGTWQNGVSLGDSRADERDNITNFSGGVFE